MTRLISSVMHKSLIHYIQTANVPIGIVVDGSVSEANQHFLVVLFVLIEGANVATCHLYRFIEFRKRGDAEALAAGLKQVFENDSILDALKEKLIVFTSDGMFKKCLLSNIHVSEN